MDKHPEKMSFSEGVRALNTKGALMIPVRLTKKRALMILEFIGEFKEYWNRRHEEGHFNEDDMQATMQWLLNQVNKRWSQNDLYATKPKMNKQKNNHG